MKKVCGSPLASCDRHVMIAMDRLQSWTHSDVKGALEQLQQVMLLCHAEGDVCWVLMEVGRHRYSMNPHAVDLSLQDALQSRVLQRPPSSQEVAPCKIMRQCYC